MLSIKGLDLIIGEKKYLQRDKDVNDSIYKLSGCNIDNFGLSDIYPNYHFEIMEEGIGFTILVTEINQNFELKLYPVMYISKEHIDKYDFVESKNHPGLFESRNYKFLRKYLFDVLESLEDERIYYLRVMKL